MLQPWRNGKVIRIANETDNTKRFWIEVEGQESFDFAPGQFVTLDLPIHEQRNKRWRSYSIASWPDGTAVFELVIVLLEGGAGTQYLFDHVDVGHVLSFRGPQGVFVLPDPIEKDLYLICTGTGIAPFRSMVHHLTRKQIPHQEIHLIFGCRRFGDCLYGPELRSLAKENPRFFYHPAFSREEPSADGTYNSGYVHLVYEQLLKEKGGQPPASFYLCGWKNMIDEARERILKLGYDKKDVHFELYG
jgi:CDP-4-dehydro-6-deoxyglucose reductase